ncbi:unnamed protein product [Trifolium pratense]|uniref:Uncharacterized protein n=1 Tax=Trifolium pratense TaxID=57577 RepID=A0ACB0LQA1_TRIPR|nr:unnamed protein product [Trifolium pratense]
MSHEIIEEKEESHWFINTKDQKEKIMKIIQYQKSQYLSTTSSSSPPSLLSSAASSSSYSKSRSLLELMKGGSTSMRRLFDMEHISLSNHFDYYSGSPIIKPISLWDSDSEREFQDPWDLIKKIGSTSFYGIDRESELASKGSHMDGDFVSQNINDKKGKHKLTRKKNFRRLPGLGFWRRGRFIFTLRLRRIKFRIWGRKFS